MAKLEEKQTFCKRANCKHRIKFEIMGEMISVCCGAALEETHKKAGLPPPMIPAPLGNRCKLNPELVLA